MSWGRSRIDWQTADGLFTALEPDAGELAAAAPALAAAYNDPHNASLMGATQAMTAAEVVEHYQAMSLKGARQFLLQRDGALVGDADLRNPRDGAAEFAILIAARSQQGRGLGTRFTLLVHAFAFQRLALERVYVSVIPRNEGSKRMFEKVGYLEDQSPAARRFADEAGDLTLSLDRARFLHAHAAALETIAISSLG